MTTFFCPPEELAGRVENAKLATSLFGLPLSSPINIQRQNLAGDRRKLVRSHYSVKFRQQSL